MQVLPSPMRRIATYLRWGCSVPVPDAGRRAASRCWTTRTLGLVILRVPAVSRRLAVVRSSRYAGSSDVGDGDGVMLLGDSRALARQYAKRARVTARNTDRSVTPTPGRCGRRRCCRGSMRGLTGSVAVVVRIGAGRNSLTAPVRWTLRLMVPSHNRCRPVRGLVGRCAGTVSSADSPTVLGEEVATGRSRYPRHSAVCAI